MCLYLHPVWAYACQFITTPLGAIYVDLLKPRFVLKLTQDSQDTQPRSTAQLSPDAACASVHRMSAALMAKSPPSWIATAVARPEVLATIPRTGIVKADNEGDKNLTSSHVETDASRSKYRESNWADIRLRSFVPWDLSQAVAAFWSFSPASALFLTAFKVRRWALLH